MDDPAAAQLSQLSGAATQLAREVQDVLNRMRDSSDDAVRRTGYRLDDLAGELRRAAVELRQTATDLTRVTGIRADTRLCQADWGVCPEHGNTLSSSGGISSCRVDGRLWNYDRLATPCGDRVTAEVTDPEGGTTRLCHGHALALPEQPGWYTRSVAAGR